VDEVNSTDPSSSSSSSSYAHVRLERLDSRFPVVTHRDLSPSIGFKRKFLTVDVTVSPACPDEKFF